MRVAIAGGHGKVALRLTRLLTQRGDEVRSLIRNPDHEPDVRHEGAEPVICDLEEASEDEVAVAVGVLDAIVFAAGAGPGSGPERKWTMDYGGAVKLIAAAKKNGIRRYVIVSSMGADPDARRKADDDEDVFAIYQAAKGKADQELAESGLDYTICRPGGLTDEPGLNRVDAREEVERGRIPRDDVAAVLAAVLATPSTIGKTFCVVSGDTEIYEAVEGL